MVTNAFKGEDLNGYTPIFSEYGIPELYNFQPEDMRWIAYQPKARMRVLDEIYPEGISIPDYFIGKNIVHLPTVKCHIYTTTTGAMKNAFGGLLNTQAPLHPHLDPRDAGGPAGHPEGDPPRHLRRHGRHDLPGTGPGPRTMIPVDKNVILASARPGGHRRRGGQDDGLRSHDHRLHPAGPRERPRRGRPEEIEIVGDSTRPGRTGTSRSAVSFHKFVGWITWYGPTRFLQKADATAAALSRQLLLVLLSRHPALAAPGSASLREVAKDVGSGAGFSSNIWMKDHSGRNSDCSRADGVRPDGLRLNRIPATPFFRGFHFVLAFAVSPFAVRLEISATASVRSQTDTIYSKLAGVSGNLWLHRRHSPASPSSAAAS